MNNPLDPSPFMGDPCKLVRSDDLAALGYIKPGDKQDTQNGSAGALGGPACGWRSDGTEFVTVMLQAADDRTTGLQNTYANYKAGRLAYWEPTTIGDYPAAFTSALDDRGNGGCGLTVGIADDLTFSAAADFYIDDPDQACQAAKTLAESVVETLKKGGS